jgi:V/A-type H+-transporting ATPase subunit A
MIREDFLQQSAYSDTDSFCPVEKQYWMLKAIHSYDSAINIALERGVSLKQITALAIRAEIARMRELGSAEEIQALTAKIPIQVDGLEGVQ